MSLRHKISILLAEFVGTFVLATAMMAMLVRTNFAFFSAIAAALVYGLFMLIFGTKILTHLNPAVTLGLWTVRKVSTLNAIVYLVAQLLAGYVAYRVGQYFLGSVIPKTATGGFNFRIMIAEGVGTLVFTLALATALSDKKLDFSKKAVLAGFGLFIGIIVASLAGNGLLNPAVAISLRSISWAYILGPLVGAIVGFNLYELVVVKNFQLLSVVDDEKPAKSTSTKRKK